MSAKDKILISDMMEGFFTDMPAKPFVTFCVGCNKGVIAEDMIYEKGKVFHKDCFDKFGKNFPAINPDLLSQSTNAKVELVQLKNLQIRMTGTNKASAASLPETMIKSKRKIKKHRAKSRVTKRKTSTKKRMIKKKASRNRRKSTKKVTRRARKRVLKRRPLRRR